MIQQTLDKVFGYDRFRPGQESVISTVVAGHSAAAIFPTGAGKSLCYQLPALHLPHLTLVVSPLLALMRDQLAFLDRHGIRAASIDSTQTREESGAVMSGVRQGEIRILMISVERLKNERFRNFIAKVPISLMVVDEAHCISEWGHNFRPDYLKLPDYQRQFGIPQVLLLTATATSRVIGDMQERFGIASEHVIATGFYRENLHLDVAPTTKDHRPESLIRWLSLRSSEPTIVYVTLQKTAETVADELCRHRIRARAYHAGMTNKRRDEVQQAFMTSETTCVVATIAFGMGIDKSDIRNVVHYDLPKSIENYSQEIGRAGRDGLPSTCLMLAGRDNLNVLENFVYGDTPEHAGIAAVVDQLTGATRRGAWQWEVSLTRLAADTDIRPLPLKTLLVQLELRAIIEPRYSYFAEYRFKYRLEPDALVARFSGERRRFVAAIVGSANQARAWYTMDFEALYRRYHDEGQLGDRGRVLTALEYFADQGWIELEAKQGIDVYRIARQDFDAAALSAELHDYFKQKEESEIDRIHAMLALFESERCLSWRLASYFGDARAPERCGHCSVCEGRTARLPLPTASALLEKHDVAEISRDFVRRYRDWFDGRSPGTECITRFLCGISTPAFTRLRARGIPGFGQLEHYRYSEVRAAVEGQA